jgi:hypothetical protein
MGLFSSPKTVTQKVSSAKKEKEETAKAKSRLLETEGKNNGATLNAQQGQSVRKIFS